MGRLTQEFWRRTLRRWPQRRDERPGYTLVLPVPGDLPIFTDLALSICRTQRDEFRVETLVIPDSRSQAVEDLVEAAAPDWSGDLRVVALPALPQAVLSRRPNAFLNYGMQFLAGVGHARGSHAILHDADLFSYELDLLDGQYAACRDRGLSCFGVNRAWDPWFTDRDRIIAATWELTVDVTWARSFRPYEHMPRDWVVDGESHSFDISLYPQFRTEPAAIAVDDREHDFVHFSHVMGSFRSFQREPEGFVDSEFRLLLIRLLSDMRSIAADSLPTHEVMLQDAREGTGLYARPRDELQGNYHSFRSKLDRLLQGPPLKPQDIERIAAAVRPFDRAFGYSAL